jgi:hypothetical protein
MPAMPVITEKRVANTSISTCEQSGLTKREMFAMYAMQAILANGASEEIGYTDWSKHLANHAITAADALLKELEK